MTTAVALGAAALASGPTPGPDFDRYVEWSRAFLTHDIFALRGDVASPMGVPLSQWLFGPGLVFSLGAVDAGGFSSGSALEVGRAASWLFWVAMIEILVIVTRGRAAAVLFGLLLTFLATPAGFYSSSIASETLADAIVALLVLTVLADRHGAPSSFAMVGILSALAIITRTQLAAYAAVAMGSMGARAIANGRRGARSRAVGKVVAMLVPVTVAVVALFWVNRWMTGSPFGSPYRFGDEDFRSMDLRDPKIAAVLFHPLHGLFVYHPFYALGIAALGAGAWYASTLRVRVLLLASGAAIALQVLLHASWYCWWLGTGTFGMRGLAPAAAILVPIFVRALERARPAVRLTAGALAVVCAGWSYLLSRMGDSNFLRWGQLHAAQIAELHAALPSAAIDGTLLAALLLAVRSATLPMPSQRAAAAIRRTATCLLATVIGIMGLRFVALATATEAMLADPSRWTRRDFAYVSAVQLDEIAASSAEYRFIRGFDRERERLVEFLERERARGRERRRAVDEGAN